MKNITYKNKDVKTEKLEQLFGSKTRSQLIRLFLENPDQSFFIRQITRILNSQIHSVRRELLNLQDLGLIKVVVPKDVEQEESQPGLRSKKYYQVNKDFLLFRELKNLIEKANLLVQKDMIEKLKSTGDIKLMLLTGMFVHHKNMPTDMLIVGDVDAKKIKHIIEEYEKNINDVIRYTLMDEKEFNYRKEITDKFLYDILINRYIVIIDKISKLV